jgi:hypothetical protein
MRKRTMNAGEAEVGMKRRGNQLLFSCQNRPNGSINVERKMETN